MNYNIPTHDPKDPDAWDPQRVAAHFTQEPNDLATAVLVREKAMTHARQAYPEDGEDRADLIAAGYLAIVHAAQKADPTRPAHEIVMYLYTAAKWGMMDELNRMENVYREDFEYHTPPEPLALDAPAPWAGQYPGEGDGAYTLSDVLPGHLSDTEDDILRRIDMVYAVEKIRGERR